MSIKGQGHSLTLVKGHSDFKVKCLTFGLYIQVSDSGPLGPLVLFPFTVPCKIVFAKPKLETWPNHLSFRFLTRVRSSSYSPMAAWIFLRTSSLVTWSLYEMFNSLISKACVLFSNSAVKVHHSQAYRNMEMTRERISFTFDPRDMLFCHCFTKYSLLSRALVLVHQTF